MTKLKSYVKDTTDFVKEIENANNITDDSHLVSLVSLDVWFLYTNIPRREAIEAVRKSSKF